MAAQDDPRPVPIVCDVSGLPGSTLVTIEILARLQLTARRAGRRIVFVGARDELRDVLRALGLSDVLCCATGSGLEPVRESEEGEQPLRVEEETDPGDPAV
jgi:anti-anti-sigma regulatory factor